MNLPSHVQRFDPEILLLKSPHLRKSGKRALAGLLLDLHQSFYSKAADYVSAKGSRVTDSTFLEARSYALVVNGSMVKLNCYNREGSKAVNILGPVEEMVCVWNAFLDFANDQTERMSYDARKREFVRRS